MKMEIKPLVDSPLTQEEETQLNGFFENLKTDPKQKIVITLDDSEKPALARRKLSGKRW